MEFHPLLAENDMPLVTLQGSSRDQPLDDLIHRLRQERSNVEHYLHRSGVLLIRGHDISTAEDFRRVCAAFKPDLRNYTGGDSPRHDLCDKVYTSTEYDAELEVLLHNELSYAGWCPQTVFFGCLKPSVSGGETHIADGRKVYRMLDPEIRERFESRGVTYLQHLWDSEGPPGIGKSWQETFETSDRNEAEQYLTASGMQYQWTSSGIRTAATKPAVRTHQITGETCWHNQADQWHREMESVKDSVSGNGAGSSKTDPTCGEATLGNHVVFGDGSEIAVRDLQHVRNISKQCEVVFPWQAGDVMIIDNVLAMHGRKPFRGERQVVVAMA